MWAMIDVACEVCGNADTYVLSASMDRKGLVVVKRWTVAGSGN